MKHPAKYSAALMPVLQSMVPPDEFYNVLDPFAGTGKIHQLDNVYTYGIELEPEWADMHPHTDVGDATDLNIPDGVFDAVVTSPTYGNRMADHHEAKDACKVCRGRGHEPLVPETAKHRVPPTRLCAKCDGTGLSRRNTYKHVLGRDLSPGSSACMQWGPEYRELHERAWAEAWRVLRPGGRIVINIKDHIRKGKQQYVSWWHYQCLLKLGFLPYRYVWVATPGQRMGQNGATRLDGEWVFAFTKPTSSADSGTAALLERRAA